MANAKLTFDALVAAVGPFTYDCKKTGNKTVTINSFADIPVESLVYVIRKGTREYFDNYHAGLTFKAHGTRPTFKSEVNAMVDESLARFLRGDVPGSNVGSIVLTAEEQKMILELRAKKSA